MARNRGIAPPHDDEIEWKLEDHRRGSSPDGGARQSDLPAPTPREVEDYEEGHRGIDEKRADPVHSGGNETRIRLPHLQSVDPPDDDDGVVGEQPDRDHEPSNGELWPRDLERSA